MATLVTRIALGTVLGLGALVGAATMTPSDTAGAVPLERTLRTHGVKQHARRGLENRFVGLRRHNE
jgi:hypothetical protein